MRLEGKIAVIVGAGQSPGEGMGNGRATTLRFAQEGARILAVDRLMASAEETAAMATQGGECVPFAADVTKEETLAAAMEAARARWGRIDILHNNVGVSIGGGDKPLDELSEEAFDRVCAINLRGTIMACKHVLPIMRLQRSGAIINISSVAARENSYPLVTYKATKAAMIAFTEQLALQNVDRVLEPATNRVITRPASAAAKMPTLAGSGTSDTAIIEKIVPDSPVIVMFPVAGNGTSPSDVMSIITGSTTRLSLIVPSPSAKVITICGRSNLPISLPTASVSVPDTRRTHSAGTGLQAAG